MGALLPDIRRHRRQRQTTARRQSGPVQSSRRWRLLRLGHQGLQVRGLSQVLHARGPERGEGDQRRNSTASHRVGCHEGNSAVYKPILRVTGQRCIVPRGQRSLQPAVCSAMYRVLSICGYLHSGRMLTLAIADIIAHVTEQSTPLPLPMLTQAHLCLEPLDYK